MRPRTYGRPEGTGAPEGTGGYGRTGGYRRRGTRAHGCMGAPEGTGAPEGGAHDEGAWVGARPRAPRSTRLPEGARVPRRAACRVPRRAACPWGGYRRVHARPWRGYRRVPRALHARGRAPDHRVPIPRKPALPRELHGHGVPRDRVPRAPRNRVELLFGISRNPALRGTQILEIPRRSSGPLRPRRAHRLFALGPCYLPPSVWGMQPVQAVLADQGRLQTTSTGATGPPTGSPQAPEASCVGRVGHVSVDSCPTYRNTSPFWVQLPTFDPPFYVHSHGSLWFYIYMYVCM